MKERLVKLKAAVAQVMFSRKQYFSQAKDEITAINLNTMFMGCVAGVFFVLFFFIISPYIVEGWKITKEYVLLLPTMAAYAIFAFVYRRRKNVSYMLVQFVCILAYSSLLAIFLAISVFPYPDDPETFISLFIMLMSVLFIVKPYVILLISVAFGGVFIYLTIATRNEVCIAHDVFSTIAAIAFSQLMLVFVTRLRVADYFSREKLVTLSNSDPLTGILNKAACETESDLYITAAHSDDYAVLIIDIDDFKNINDVYGHQMGDDLLKLMANALTSAVRSSDIVGRIGGDEFCVLLKNIPGREITEDKAKRIIEAIPLRSQKEYGVNMTCSIGVALSSTGMLSFKEYYKLADEALYEVKKNGKSNFVVKA